MHARTYEATLYTPLFYASREGNVVETDQHLAATALAHALGYKYFDLRKDYVLRGDGATTPTYERLADLPFFVSDMTPVTVDASERTFRTTSYTGELNFTTTESAISPGTAKGVPNIRGESAAGWHEVRHHLGLAPGSTFEFTIWLADDTYFSDDLSFRMGMDLTGEFRAHRTDERSVPVAVNEFLLTSVYNVGEGDDGNDTLTELLLRSDTFVRGNDPRLHRFEGVDVEYVTDNLAPRLVDGEGSEGNKTDS